MKYTSKTASGILAFCLMIIIGTFASQSAFAAEAPLVQTGPDKSADITVYGNSFAQIEETRTVELKAGANRIQLDGISGQYTNDSLRLIAVTGPGAFKYNSATYQPANLNRDQILTNSVGGNVTITVGTGQNAQSVTGKLISARSGQIIVVDSAGKTYMTQSSNVILDKLPEGLSNTASLVVEATADVAGTYELKFFYESRGFSWSAKHSLIFNEEAQRLDDWQTTVNVVNQSGTTFEGANLWLLSGDVPQNARDISMRSGSAYKATADFAAESAAVESVGERKVYKIPGLVDLVNGQSRQIPLFSAADIPVDKEFVLTSYDYKFRSSSNLLPVTVLLNLNNCEKDNLGTPLPAATVKVYQANSEGKLQLTATTSVKELAADEVFALDIGTSSDVKASVKLVRSQEVDASGTPVQSGLRPNNSQPRFQEQEWLISIHNFKQDDDVDVTVKAQIPGNLDNVSPFTRETSNIGTADVKVLKTDSTELNYTFRVRIN